MGCRAVFLDRDGTVNVDRGYVSSVDAFEYVSGAKDALKLLESLGYSLVVVTNQSGIARGLYTEQDFEVLTQWMRDDLAASGIQLSGVYHCPHHPDYTGVCECRKPALGMFKQAVDDLGIDLGSSWAIGDHCRDLSICEVSACRGFLLGEAMPNEVLPQGVRRSQDLFHAAKTIEREMKK